MWTPPRTWIAGEVVTAVQLNTHVRDNFNEVFRATSRDTSEISAQNTADPISLYNGSVHSASTGWTIPGGMMGTGRGVRLTIMGDAVYNNSDSDNCNLITYVGNEDHIGNHDLFSPGTPAAGPEGWHLQIMVMNLASNKQWVTTQYSTPRISGMRSSNMQYNCDTSADWKLDVVADWTAASVNNRLTKKYTLIELI